MEDKCKEVTEWLTEVLERDDPVAFEATDRTVDALLELRRIHQNRMEQMKIAAEVDQQIGEASEEKAKRKLELLLRLGVDQNKLSNGGNLCLEALTNAALNLNLHEPYVQDFLVEISGNELKIDELEQQLEEIKSQNLDLEKEYISAKSTKEQIESFQKKCHDLVNSEITQLRSKISAMDFWVKKTNEYKSNLREFKMPTLTYERLEEEHSEFEKLKAAVNDMEKQLETYHGLPANMKEAKELLQDEKNKLADLDNELGYKLATQGSH